MADEPKVVTATAHLRPVAEVKDQQDRQRLPRACSGCHKPVRRPALSMAAWSDREPEARFYRFCGWACLTLWGATNAVEHDYRTEQA